MPDKPNTKPVPQQVACHQDFINVSQMMAYGASLAQRRTNTPVFKSQRNENEEKRQRKQGLTR